MKASPRVLPGPGKPKQCFALVRALLLFYLNKATA